MLDEPELGLHPYAVVVLAGLLRSAAERTQIIVSTQSVTLVNQLSPVLVEGQTEETFVREVLRQHLGSFDLYVTPVVVTTKRVKSGLKFKGGVSRYSRFRTDLRNLLGDRSAAAITTMFDYYGLPADFPGHDKLFLSYRWFRAAQIRRPV